ncbi:MAG: hypothetical protein ACOYJG_03300 [Prevotella sp.]|jgi:hypothetical protein
MDTDELQLFNKVGKKECFRVPEGYFSHLADRVGEKLPPMEQPRTSFRLLLRRHRILAAASVAAVLGLSSILLFSRHSDTQQQPVQTQSAQTTVSSYSSSDRMLDEFADFAMLDNDAIYSYLEENEK